MKSIRNKLIIFILPVIILGVLGIGVITLLSSYDATKHALEQSMTETVKVVALFVEESLETYKAVAAETGCVSRFSNPDISLESKAEIINEKIRQYGFLGGNFTDTKGKGQISDVDVSDRDYFKAAISGQAVVSDVIFSRSINKYTVNVAAPLWEGGVYGTKIIGIVYFNVDIGYLSNIVQHTQVGKTGDVYMLDKDGYTIAAHDEKIVEERENIIEKAKTDKSLEPLAIFNSAMIKQESGSGDYTHGGIKEIIAYTPVGINNWSVAVTVQEKEFLGIYTQLIYIMLLLMAVFAGIGATILFITANGITRPVKQLENAAKEMACGNFNVNISTKGHDEVAALSVSVATMRDNVLRLIDGISDVIKESALGNIDYRIPADEFNGEYKNVASGINSIISGFNDETLAILDSYGKLGGGDFNATLKQMPGKKVIANQKFDDLKKNLNALSADISKLIDGAIDGKLSVRVEASHYEGGWNKITTGLNSLLEAVSEPMNEVKDSLTLLSQGKFDFNVNKVFKGEFAEMMNSLDTTVRAVGSYIGEITEILEAVAQNDLTKQIKRDYIGQFNQIKSAINRISNDLKITVTEIMHSSENVLAGARQLSDSSMDLANGASSQAIAVEELNASITLVREQTSQNSALTRDANGLSKKSIDNANQGNDEMRKMLQSMSDIKEASNNIAKIIKVIDEIAFQTNLLALNAAVEAARAGEAGKGFAVVADEVRSLASRSQTAAKETSEYIEDAILKVNEGTHIASQTSNALNTIVENINSVSSIMESITRANDEQTESITQIIQGVTQISDVVQKNSAASEETAATAEELNSQSELLHKMVDVFKI